MGTCGDVPEERELFRRAQSGDQCARDALLERHSGLVHSLCQRFPSLGSEGEDLVQAGFLGLLRAVDGFDPDLGRAFSTYAVPHILGEMRKHLRAAAGVSVSRRARGMVREVEGAADEMAARTGRVPSLAEVAERLGFDPAEIALAQEALRAPSALYDLVPSPREDPGRVELLSLKDAVDRLEPIHRDIIQRRYFEDQTQAQIARDLGRSQAQVSRLQKQALRRLRQILD
ncbi:MAG: sigma-70 family RNA polymerase sigma factor [Bacillota bacterium]